MVLRKGWNLLVSLNRIALEILFAFVTVGNPISKQLIKKMTSIRFMSIYLYMSIINIQKTD
jgi:hypothetical protein